ncbi:uncharacterized protein LOC112193324 isoform X2 [Rosa chinensis]|uniref:uncharacterized protein LOC112193324 isoform X2 n=1 Tax=Rosa chinensis TaxID=74649 RepID=UPI000D08AD83|nr:uncharacterized protein LOC112193324 isoform X2 [Rosa chinensis]
MISEEEGNARVLWCLKCKEGTSGTNRLLVCCENGCPIVIHEECMTVQPQFDDMGHFYCPYCAYKWISHLCKQKEKMLNLSALKLTNWILRATEGDSEQRRRREVDDDEENGGVSARQDFENVKGGERQEEREPLVVEPLLTVRLSDIQGTSDGDEGLGKRVAEEEDNGTRKLPKSLSTSFVCLDRRRVLWTKEEEQALKEGVKEFWTTNRKSIPWEKICQAYKDRFHSSRTAANLKDKWKFMTKTATKKGCFEELQVSEVK